MARQLMTVCVLCLLCASHAQCSGPHGGVSGGVETAALQELRSGRARKPHCSSCRRLRRDILTTDHERVTHPSDIEPQVTQKVDDSETDIQLHRIFTEFGDPKQMTLNFKGFTRLVQSGRLMTALTPPRSPKTHPVNNTESNTSSNSNTSSSSLKSDFLSTPSPQDGLSWQCLQPREFLGRYGVENDVVRPDTLLQMCPTLLARSVASMSQEDEEGCVMVPYTTDPPEQDTEEGPEGASVRVWLCATGSIVVVSLCGLLGVGVIPFMQRVFYQQLLQFLVALAVGTLCGDALLHLLPHAILGPETHGHGHGHGHAHGHGYRVTHADVQREYEEYSQHTAAVWRGLVACLGLIFFFVTEKCLTLVAEWRKRRQRRAQPAGGHRHRVKVMRDIGAPTRNNSREGGCTANGSSNAGNGRGDMGVEADGAVVARTGKQCKHKYSSYPYCYGEISDAADIPASGEAEGLTAATRLAADHVPCCVEEMKLPGSGDGVEIPDVPADMHPSECESYTVIIREHETTHHGHSHAHGHVHAAPRTMSSVAWMVVMGDGLHNLTDGVAIGAAFAAGLPGGFSTALAVLCHELPHELGDFAVLLKAGMSLKQAVFYNVLSSLLCLMGMLFGVALGHSPTVTPWVFGAAAGMFLYIALVDMIPELSSNHSQEGGSVCQCVLQVLGMLTGTGVMLLIAIYEHDLKSVFDEGAGSH
ncbi:hypothetical protein R5R35_007618 [Gryllus longicercus]